MAEQGENVEIHAPVDNDLIPPANNDGEGAPLNTSPSEDSSLVKGAGGRATT